MTAKEILVVDDEIGIRELLSEILFDEGYRVVTAENAAQARDIRGRQVPDLVLLDIWMPEMDGVSLLREWVSHGQLTMPVIMMSGHGTIETAVEATRIGAVDFLEKPIALQKLLEAVSRAIRQGVLPGSQPGLAPVPGNGLVHERQAFPDETDRFPLPLDLPLREARDHFDSYYFNYHMRKEGGNVSSVAQKIGLERTHLYRKLKQLGIKVSKSDS